MRICYFADSESIHTERWCKHFQSLGHDIHLITYKSKQIEGIKTYSVNMGTLDVSGGNWRVLLRFRQVRKLLKEIKPDVFHALYATSYGITGALCGFHPYIISSLGSDILISPKNSRIYRILLKFAFKRADLIMVMADHMIPPAKELGAKESKIVALPFGIDQQIFNSENRSVPEDEFVITCTRNFEPIYNMPHLLKALQKVVAEIPNIRVNLIGSGSQKEELMRMTEEFGLASRVHFLGKIPQREIADYLNKSHVFVSLSLSDGNNISLNEAMACGTWNIVTDIPANHQWIKDGENGFFVQIDDVDGLANLIVRSRNEYHELMEKAVVLNDQLLREKGIWQINMQKAEKWYLQLIND
ncbi:glycosyltransferase [Fluviicola sp.]|uniref:glycosyltransferase n=1 Tax=Fluviicola sp. TaxID=1917219 RepID=UPI0031DCDF8F